MTQCKHAQTTPTRLFTVTFVHQRENLAPTRKLSQSHCLLKKKKTQQQQHSLIVIISLFLELNGRRYYAAVIKSSGLKKGAQNASSRGAVYLSGSTQKAKAKKQSTAGCRVRECGMTPATRRDEAKGSSNKFGLSIGPDSQRASDNDTCAECQSSATIYGRHALQK